MLLSFSTVEVMPCENTLTAALVNAGTTVQNDPLPHRRPLRSHTFACAPMCVSGSKGGFYCQANLEALAWPQCFDKYKQMWVRSSGATGYPLEVDNHAVRRRVLSPGLFRLERRQLHRRPHRPHLRCRRRGALLRRSRWSSQWSICVLRTPAPWPPGLSSLACSRTRTAPYRLRIEPRVGPCVT